MSNCIRRCTIVLVCALTAPGALLAQAPAEPAASTAAAAPVLATPGVIVAISPFAPLLAAFSGEFEARAARAVTLGISGSFYFGDELDIASSADAHFRYYPSERAPDGFAIGATLGFVSVPTDEACAALGNCENGGTTAAYGTDISYNFLLGPRKRFVVGLGIGAKRLVRSIKGLDVLPTARLQVGYAF